MDWSSVDGCIQNIDGNQVATIQCLPALMVNIGNAAFIFAGIVAVAFIIIAGFTLMNSGGDPKKVATAQGTLTYAIIGLILCIMSIFIVNVIADLTGVSCIKFFGFTNCG